MPYHDDSVSFKYLDTRTAPPSTRMRSQVRALYRPLKKSLHPNELRQTLTWDNLGQWVLGQSFGQIGQVRPLVMSQGFFRWDNLGQNCTRSARFDLATSPCDQSSPIWAILDVMSF
jgi:hypothetical protein